MSGGAKKDYSARVKHFDFTRKPIKPTFLMWLAKRIISFPDLKKREARLTEVGMEDIKGKPYILLVTHSSMVDFNLMLKATDGQPVNNVMTLEGFNTYTLPLMHLLGVIAKRKYVHDLRLVRNIKYSLKTLGCVFVLFPEARYSLDGCESFVPDSTASLVKLMKVPVAVLSIHGNFVTCPQWNKKNKGTYVEATLEGIISEEETKTLSVDEIMARIHEKFDYDDYKWQFDNKIKIDDRDRARGLHSLLYKCPHCNAEYETDSEGDELFCRHCGARWRQDEYGRLSGINCETVYPHIPDWTAWERECVRREVRDGSYIFEDRPRIMTLPGWTRFYDQGVGYIRQTPEGTYVEVPSLYGGEKFSFMRRADDLDSMHIEYDYLGRGDCIEVSLPDDSFWCYLTGRDRVTKISFATEEIYKLAIEKKKENAK